ncbi:MAG TPA: peroxidase [Anaerolineae bacterium]|nr:peroxidase [Anaerolineae bacterium]
MNEQEADEFVHAVARDWKNAPLLEQDMTLCKYAEKLTHSPAKMSPADLDELRNVGFDDVAIHDATQVISYFNYINRIADALGVEPEDFIPPWGVSK